MTDHKISGLKRLTVRLAAADFELLREASHKARIRPAELARVVLISSLSADQPAILPPPAPPLPDELSAPSKSLLIILHASISNLTQINVHAGNNEQLTRLVGPNGPLDRLSTQLQEMGLKIKNGSMLDDEAEQNIHRLAAPADRLNRLARALNIESSTVLLSEWHGSLSDLTKGLNK